MSKALANVMRLKTATTSVNQKRVVVFKVEGPFREVIRVYLRAEFPFKASMQVTREFWTISNGLTANLMGLMRNQWTVQNQTLAKGHEMRIS
jgi:hypothetical protein